MKMLQTASKQGRNCQNPDRETARGHSDERCRTAWT
jgi:hypothetical protein